MEYLELLTHWNIIFKPEIGEENVHGKWICRDIVNDTQPVSVVGFADSYERHSDYHNRVIYNTVEVKKRDVETLIEHDQIYTKNVLVEMTGETFPVHIFSNPQGHYCHKLGYTTNRQTGRSLVFDFLKKQYITT